MKVAASSQLIGIHFATDPNQPASYFSGIELSQNAVKVLGLGSEHHLRSSAASRWGDVVMTRDALVAAGQIIIGRELTLSSVGHSIRPAAPLLSRLRNLREAAAHLAKTAPDILVKPEIARAMDHALVKAMISCLACGGRVGVRNVESHHTRVMQRLEELLQANAERPLHMAELCAATGVSYWTLRACCQEHLGMSPKRYLLLRRIHLARRALRRANPGSITVTEVASNYGFWEFGRFSVVYRSLFGESPSTTLRRPPDEPRPSEIGGSPWQFPKTA
jgi:AraC-like DNA-binding protein